MMYETKVLTAELILTDAICDYAKSTGKSIAEVRDEIIASGACDDLYDFENGLWTQGPDYFISYFLEKREFQNLMQNAGKEPETK